MTYRQLKQILDDPETDPYFVGEVWTIGLVDDEQLDQELNEADATCVKMMASAYRVALPRSKKDLEEEAALKERVEIIRAKEAAAASAEESRYQAGLEAIKSDKELWNAYNSANPEVRNKIDNGARFQGANVLSSKSYYLGLIKK